MEVVEKGNKTVECPRCGCVMKFDYEDIKADIVDKAPNYWLSADYWKIEYIYCPQCHKKIEIDKIHLS